MRIVFNGTGIRVTVQARQPRDIQRQMDDGTPQLLAGLGDSALQALLYQVGGLSDSEQHELVCPAGGESWFVLAGLTRTQVLTTSRRRSARRRIPH